MSEPLWFSFLMGDQSTLVLGMGIALIFFAPFGLYGMIKTFEWFYDNYVRPGKGFIKVRLKMPNGRWRVMWKRPSGQSVKINMEGVDTDVPLNFDKNYMGFEGSVPFVELDETLQQMPLDRTTITIPAEHQTRMSYLAYIAGKMAAFKEYGAVRMLVIILLFVSIIGFIGAGYMLYKIQENMAAIEGIGPALDGISNTLANITTPTRTVPMVGG